MKPLQEEEGKPVEMSCMIHGLRLAPRGREKPLCGIGVTFGPQEEGRERTRLMSMTRVSEPSQESVGRKLEIYLQGAPRGREANNHRAKRVLGRRAGRFGQKCLIGVFEIDYILGKHTGGAYTSRRKKDLIYINLYILYYIYYILYI